MITSSEITVERPWQIKDKMGLKFGKLTVVAFRGTRSAAGQTRARWLCRCVCGSLIEVAGGNLRADGRGTTACGCVKAASFDKFVLRLWRSYKRECEDPRKLRLRPYRLNRGFHLTVEDVKALIVLPCYYCGESNQNSSRLKKTVFRWNGIDRKDNGLGYTPSNCVSCCRQCNVAKGTQSVEQFLAWINRVADFQRRQSPHDLRVS